MSKNNALTHPTAEAETIIRDRQKKVLKEGWMRAFRAVILHYVREGDAKMADLLRLDLDRFTRKAEEEAEVAARRRP